MVQTIPAQDISLLQLSERFGLERTDDEQFFREWQDDLPELNDLEKSTLDEVKDDYLHLSQYPFTLDSIPPSPPSQGGNRTQSPPCEGGFRGINTWWNVSRRFVCTQ